MPEQFKEEKLSPETGKTNYWNSFAMSRFPEMRLLFQGGKLWKKEGWRNVAEHCLVEASISEILSDALHLPLEEKEELVKAALCHDWNKRLEKKPKDFSNDDYKKATELLKKINPDTAIMAAPELLVSRASAKDESTLLQRLQLYVDAICSDSDIVSIDQRIDKTKPRYPNYGENYWQAYGKLARDAEMEIFELLQKQGVNLEHPGNIPAYVKSKIEEKYTLEP